MSVRRLNHAVLWIREVERSVAFYTEVFGFQVDHLIPGRAAFLSAPGSLNDHDLGLFAIGSDAPGPEQGRVGLYHLAWEVGTLGELAELGRELTERGALVGATDHLVSKSFYAKDPDGNEFELMWRVPREDWPAADSDLRSGPLDLPAAIARWGTELATGSAAGDAS
ncbi:VOC family protein (plasmid) [Streptomyces goshikiensis]|uniref:VOC family protein n=2 Tax=Actinomycetes TaxID=1760 RepID=A0ABZ1RWF2_9ACTN|nr:MULTISPECIES: VOC family protein [Streptomyces]AKL70874.1 glyoxalase [Streptomyces sp. Mg1]AYV32488.1 Catechol-2,3-dioxygenase [Streptomyces sp. ADI95-16]EDX23870.1 glyoxalase/bleomycin resistance protein/dioxygenase [Streptomyces sp. Mg1]MBP0932117.1 VOC family protein [Streptomyces sp. KCTC 0041BP]MBT1187162.1 VOC family protein [Streptomyces sp. CJ_13]